MRMRLRLCLHLLFALFAVFLTLLNSLATPMAAPPTKSALPAASSSVTTTTIELSVSRSGGRIGLSAECLGPARAFHSLATGILKLNCGIFAEIGRSLAAKSAGQLGREGEALASQITGAAKNTESWVVNGRVRIPDHVLAQDIVTRNPTIITEVKNVQYQSLTRQLRDYADLVAARCR